MGESNLSTLPCAMRCVCVRVRWGRTGELEALDDHEVGLAHVPDDGGERHRAHVDEEVREGGGLVAHNVDHNLLSAAAEPDQAQGRGTGQIAGLHVERLMPHNRPTGEV